MTGIFGITKKARIVAIAVALARPIGIFLARRVVRAEYVRHIAVLGSTATVVTLTANIHTRQAGVFGLWFDGAARHEIIGEIIHRTARSVTRRILTPHDTPIPRTTTAVWTGHIYRGPQVLDPEFTEVQIPVAGGHAPAWRLAPPISGPSISGPSAAATWAIHIHGIRSSRITALRTVPAAHALGYTSLVASFRGDGDAPATPNGYSSLGQREWEDVDAALGYAVENGAKAIVLFGWSMGATIALLLSERSQHRHLIERIVLIGPPTNWSAVIRYGATQVRLPGVLGRLAALTLSDPSLSELAGLPEPIDVDALDWTSQKRLTRPTLVIHSSADRKIPLSLTHRFAAKHPGLVDVVDVPGAQHGCEFNLSPETFTRAIADWSTRIADDVGGPYSARESTHRHLPQGIPKR